MLSQFLWINGRSGRLQWWLTMIVQLSILLLAVPLLLPDGMDGVSQLNSAEAVNTAASGSPMLVPIVIFVAWLGLVSNIRRYHDRNKTGWWILSSFVPLIGPLWQFVELGFLRGTDGDNHYGTLTRHAALDDDENPRPASGGLAKIDDNYLKDYAQRFAAEQAARTAAQAPGPASPAGSGGGSFGRRR